MSHELGALLVAAAGIGFVHTLIGPDHYVPFIAMAKARGWSHVKTLWITLVCGVGHVGSSVVLGSIGIAAGISLKWLELTESVRGDIAAWLLTSFGLVYLVWGLRRAFRGKTHTHKHAHALGVEHEHPHSHQAGHVHPHDQASKNITAWVLFTIFLFGPCEPLIPLLMYPAVAKSLWSVALVAGVFSVATISTMVGLVLASTFGLRFIPTQRIQRYNHAIAGALIFLCGVAIHLGL